MANKGANPLILYSALSLICSIIFNFAVTNMASLYILGDLGGAFSTGSYSLAFFGFGNCVSVPLGKVLGLKFGRKNMLTVCLFFYILTTLFAGLAPTYPIFIIIRFFQGTASGPMLIVIVSLLTKLATIDERRKFIRKISIIITTVSVIAASVGGTLAYLYNWRYTFIVLTALITFIGAVLLYALRDVEYPKEDVTFDTPGYTAFFIGILSTASYFTLAYQLDYLRSPLLRFLLPLGVISLIYFVIHSWNHPAPILSFHLLKNPTLVVGLFVIFILFSTYFGVVFLLSQWLHLYANYTPWYIMLTLGIMAFTTLGLMLLVNRINLKYRLFILITGILFFAISCYYSATFDVEINFGRIAISRMMAGIGLALILPPLLMLVLCSCNESEGIDGLVLFQSVRTVASGLGGPIFATIWMRREIFYHSRLGSSLSEFSERTDEFFKKLTPFHLTPEQEHSELGAILSRQATSLALNDTFYAMGLILTATIAIILVYRLFIKPRLKSHLTI